jgi:hypothetical protein
MPDRIVRLMPLEQFQEKWKLVFRPELRKNKTIERFCDSEKSGNALAFGFINMGTGWLSTSGPCLAALQ